MRVLVLGTAAGGGVPQWNCACEQCERARRDGPHRTQDCLAISGDGTRWHLVNASPDIRTQIIGAAPLAPGPGRRDTPIAGALLTDAELDHALGLLALRENSGLAVYGTAPVLGALSEGFPVRRILDPYGAVAWHTVTPGTPLDLDERLRVTAFPVGAKRPRYAAGLGPSESDWVVAYRFEDRATGGRLVYAPCFGEWSESLEEALAGAQCALLDGTFLHDDEMVRATGSGSTARAMGHLPILDSLSRLRGRPGLRVLFTHINNTNPLLQDRTVEFARDGQTFEL